MHNVEVIVLFQNLIQQSVDNKAFDNNSSSIIEFIILPLKKFSQMEMDQ